MKDNVEMECVPGIRQELKSVVRYVDGRETMALESQPVYDPCIKRIPVTRKTIKLDPRAAVQKARARGLFLLGLPANQTKKVAYEEVSILLQDQKGKVVLRQGDVSSSLLVD